MRIQYFYIYIYISQHFKWKFQGRIQFFRSKSPVCCCCEFDILVASRPTHILESLQTVEKDLDEREKTQL